MSSHDEPMEMLFRASRAVMRQLSSALVGLDLSGPQYLVLKAIDRDKISQREIVNRTGMDKSTVTDVIRRLETAGLVERHGSEDDGRSKLAEVTRDGWKKLKQARHAARKVEERVEMIACPEISFFDAVSGLIRNA